MKLTFEPNRGAEPLLIFGVDRSTVRRSLSPLAFRTKATEPESDFYETEGLILGYDNRDRLEFVEVFPPSTAEFKGLPLLESTVDEVFEHLRHLGYSSEFDDGGYEFSSIGLAIYCPAGRIESASVFREGYYDDL